MDNDYNLVNLYHAYQKFHYEKHNMASQIREFRSTENYIEHTKLSRTGKYMLDGFYKDYPLLSNEGWENIYNQMKNDNNIYFVLDDIFCKMFG